MSNPDPLYDPLQEYRDIGRDLRYEDWKDARNAALKLQAYLDGGGPLPAELSLEDVEERIAQGMAGPDMPLGFTHGWPPQLPLAEIKALLGTQPGAIASVDPTGGDVAYFNWVRVMTEQAVRELKS